MHLIARIDLIRVARQLKSIDRHPALVKAIERAAAAGSIRDQADRAAFLATRALKDSPRWALAINDVDLNVAKHLSCAVGVELTPKTTPKLVALIHLPWDHLQHLHPPQAECDHRTQH